MAVLSTLTVKIIDDRYHGDWGQPKQMSEEAAGIDLRAAIIQPMYVNGNIEMIGTGIAVAIPKGYVGLLYPRSSWGKKGLELANTVGVIDSDYRGEIIAMVRNKRSAEGNLLRIEPGDRIVQLVIVPIAQFVHMNYVDEFSEEEQTERGEGGIGSTDVKG